MRITWNLKHQCRIVRRKKALKLFEVGQGSRPCGTTLYQKVEIFDILGPHSHPLWWLRWNIAQPSGPSARRPCQVWRESVLINVLQCYCLCLCLGWQTSWGGTQTKLATMSLVAETMHLPVSRQYGNSYPGTSQSAVSDNGVGTN